MTHDRPSSTALVVARALYFVSLDDELGHLVPREEAALMARFIAAASPGSGWFLRWSARRWFRWIVCGFASMAAQGLLPWLAVRKRHIEALVRQAVDEGAEELIVVGAGYDALAPRLAREMPRLRCIEIDHPATQKPKRRVLGDLPPNHELLSVDLSRAGLSLALANSKLHQSDAKAVLVAEGLAMYLTEEDVRLLLRPVGRGSRIIFTFLERDAEGHTKFGDMPWLLGLYLRAQQEEFKWSIRREMLPQFLESEGLQVQSIESSHPLKELYLPDVDVELSPWELIATATRI